MRRFSLVLAALLLLSFSASAQEKCDIKSVKEYVSVLTPLIAKGLDDGPKLSSLIKKWEKTGDESTTTSEENSNSGFITTYVDKAAEAAGKGEPMVCNDVDLPGCIRCSAGSSGTNQYKYVTYSLHFEDVRYARVARKAFIASLGAITKKRSYEVKQGPTYTRYQKVLREIPYTSTTNGVSNTNWEVYWDRLQVSQRQASNAKSSALDIRLSKNIQQKNLKHTPRGVGDGDRSSNIPSTPFQNKDRLSATEFESELLLLLFSLEKVLATDQSFSGIRGEIAKTDAVEEHFGIRQLPTPAYLEHSLTRTLFEEIKDRYDYNGVVKLADKNDVKTAFATFLKSFSAIGEIYGYELKESSELKARWLRKEKESFISVSTSGNADNPVIIVWINKKAE